VRQATHGSSSIKQRDRRRYILLQGVLVWGAPMALLTTTANQLLGRSGKLEAGSWKPETVL
jgi:hypothetical protein